MKAKNRFYVGHPRMMEEVMNGPARWAKGTIAEAVAHAREIVEKTGEPQLIVKVIRIVRQRKPPVEVETIE